MRMRKVPVKRLLAQLKPWKEKYPKRNPNLTGKPWLDQVQYPIRNQYLRQRYQALMQEKGEARYGFLIIAQCNYTSKNPPKKIAGLTERLVMQRVTNSMFPLENTRFAPMRPLLTGSTNIIHRAEGRDDEENFLDDLRFALDLDPTYLQLFPAGALIQGTIVGHNDLIRLSKFKNMDEVRSQLVSTLQNPLHQVVRTLSFPQNQLIKALDFQAKALQASIPPESDATATATAAPVEVLKSPA
eukprot:gb/GEZN01016250.1/.p1 GENE.gb/GEZN01016250.1/~~gb/GEZN01016250.1/.p1  ORF type:complete len:242 (+),score=23.34 gb/GEZN01016250.1/:64-789(+)